jgi:glycosyltransferase involved in cell wall biosynthesis
VDNSPGDDNTEAVAREFGARYTVEPVEGLSRARNRGLTESNSEIVTFIDDDCEPDPKWLSTLLEPFKDERIAATMGRVVTPVTRPEFLANQESRSLSNQDPRWFEIATFGGLGMGGNMALRKSACVGWKVFDERLGRGAPLQIGEETHAFAELLSRGFTAVNLPAAIVYHPPLKRDTVEHEARNSVAYWLLLFSEFPDHRIDLLRFLAHRLRRRHLSWHRESREPGEIITSGWRVYLKAGIAGALLFLHNARDRS